jgi:hypothetical protein
MGLGDYSFSEPVARFPFKTVDGGLASMPMRTALVAQLNQSASAQNAVPHDHWLLIPQGCHRIDPERSSGWY